nr:MAG TPA: tail protein [Caudoviricetes sp.]
MIKVFQASDTTFSSNGDKVLQPLKAVIYKEDNGDYYLDLEVSIKDAEWIVNDNIIRSDVPAAWGGAQNFRVYNPYKKKDRITCRCKHVYFDAGKYLIPDSYVVDKNCNDALDHLNTGCETPTPFTTFSDIPTIKTYRSVRKSFLEAISEVINRWGGHLVRDNYSISLKSNIGADNGVVVAYGKNITDITAEEDWSSVTTKIMPVGKDGLLLPEIYLYSDVTYSTPYTRAVTFSQDLEKEEGESDEDYNGRLITDLRTQAQAFIDENQYPKINYSVKADISKITDVGDTIEVKHEPLGINVITHVISVKWDCIQERFTEVNFGNFANKLSNLIGSVSQESSDKVITGITDTVIPQVQDKLNTAYDRIWNALQNSYCIYEGDKILIVDKLPKESADYCIMMNSAGISFSQNGINGQFTSAWTIDGTFNAQNINIVNLVADMIKGGTLKLGSEIQQHGKIELYNEANRLIGQMNKDGLTMWANDGSYIKINNEVGFAGYDKNGNKVYWCDGAVFCTQKFVAKDEITVGGKLRMLPITTDTNSGIGFVAIFEE